VADVGGREAEGRLRGERGRADPALVAGQRGGQVGELAAHDAHRHDAVAGGGEAAEALPEADHPAGAHLDVEQHLHAGDVLRGQLEQAAVGGQPGARRGGGVPLRPLARKPVGRLRLAGVPKVFQVARAPSATAMRRCAAVFVGAATTIAKASGPPRMPDRQADQGGLVAFYAR
jgi:hypothetical protein